MEGSPKRSKYAGAGVSQAVKEYAAELAVALEKKGVPITTFLSATSSTVYAPRKSALYKHVAAVKRGDAPLSNEKKTGAKHKLTAEQKDIVCGAVLGTTSIVGLSFVVEWIKANFGVGVSHMYASRLMEEQGISVQLFGSRSWPEGTTKESYTLGYFDFVNDVRNRGVFKRAPGRIICIDSCTNSVRIERKRGLAMRGGRQPVSSGPKPMYTNTYVTAVTRDGSGELKTLMFTHDPTFDPKGRDYKTVKRWLEDFGLVPGQVFYIDGNKGAGGKKTYCGESSDLYSQYLRVHRDEMRDSIIFHDGGPALKIKRGGETSWVFEEGGNDVIVFPSTQHGRLSVLDNYLFGLAKTWWRKERTNENFSLDALKLLQCIEWVSKDAIDKMWTSNFLLADKKLTLTAVEELMERGPKKAFANHDRKARYERAYENWLKENEDMHGYHIPEELESQLDGSYWEMK